MSASELCLSLKDLDYDSLMSRCVGLSEQLQAYAGGSVSVVLEGGDSFNTASALLMIHARREAARQNIGLAFSGCMPALADLLAVYGVKDLLLDAR